MLSHNVVLCVAICAMIYQDATLLSFVMYWMAQHVMMLAIAFVVVGVATVSAYDWVVLNWKKTQDSARVVAIEAKNEAEMLGFRINNLSQSVSAMEKMAQEQSIMFQQQLSSHVERAEQKADGMMYVAVKKVDDIMKKVDDLANMARTKVDEVVVRAEKKVDDVAAKAHTKVDKVAEKVTGVALGITDILAIGGIVTLAWNYFSKRSQPATKAEERESKKLIEEANGLLDVMSCAAVLVGILFSGNLTKGIKFICELSGVRQVMNLMINTWERFFPSGSMDSVRNGIGFVNAMKLDEAGEAIQVTATLEQAHARAARDTAIHITRRSPTLLQTAIRSEWDVIERKTQENASNMELQSGHDSESPDVPNAAIAAVRSEIGAMQMVAPVDVFEPHEEQHEFKHAHVVVQQPSQPAALELREVQDEVAIVGQNFGEYAEAAARLRAGVPALQDGYEAELKAAHARRQETESVKARISSFVRRHCPWLHERWSRICKQDRSPRECAIVVVLLIIILMMIRRSAKNQFKPDVSYREAKGEKKRKGKAKKMSPGTQTKARALYVKVKSDRKVYYAMSKEEKDLLREMTFDTEFMRSLAASTAEENYFDDLVDQYGSDFDLNQSVVDVNTKAYLAFLDELEEHDTDDYGGGAHGFEAKAVVLPPKVPEIPQLPVADTPVGGGKIKSDGKLFVPKQKTPPLPPLPKKLESIGSHARKVDNAIKANVKAVKRVEHAKKMETNVRMKKCTNCEIMIPAINRRFDKKTKQTYNTITANMCVICAGRRPESLLGGNQLDLNRALGSIGYISINGAFAEACTFAHGKVWFPRHAVHVENQVDQALICDRVTIHNGEHSVIAMLSQCKIVPFGERKADCYAYQPIGDFVAKATRNFKLAEPIVGSPVVLVTHSDKVKRVMSDVGVVGAMQTQNGEIYHTCPSMKGNCGGAIIDIQRQVVVGIHVAGGPEQNLFTPVTKEWMKLVQGKTSTN